MLTEKGRALFPLLVALRHWGEDYCFKPHEAHVRLVDRESGRLVPHVEVHAHDGRTLAPEDTAIKFPPARASSAAQKKRAR